MTADRKNKIISSLKIKLTLLEGEKYILKSVIDKEQKNIDNINNTNEIILSKGKWLLNIQNKSIVEVEDMISKVNMIEVE